MVASHEPFFPVSVEKIYAAVNLWIHGYDPDLAGSLPHQKRRRALILISKVVLLFGCNMTVFVIRSGYDCLCVLMITCKYCNLLLTAL